MDDLPFDEGGQKPKSMSAHVPNRQNSIASQPQGDTNMKLTKILLAVFAVCCGNGSVCAQESTDSEQALREARHAMFATTASDLKIEYGEPTAVLQLNKTALLRYNNPVRGRFNDGEMFVLTDESNVPRMIVATSIRATGRLFIEAVSISGKPLWGQLPVFGKWRPKFGGSGKVVSKVQPENAETATRRLIAMRKIASSVEFKFKKREWSLARLLTQPLHRYQAPEVGITDGAIFAYGESNDPEALLHVWHELADGASEGKWYWLAAASTSLPLRCEQDDEIVWEKSGFWSSPRPPESSYVETLVANHPELVEAATLK